MRKLRIFYASDDSPNATFQGVKSNIWRVNLYHPLIDLGHEVIEFDYDMASVFANLYAGDPKQAAFIEASRPRLSSELVRQIRQAHSQTPVDVFFSYFYSCCVLPEALDEIRSMGITTINWYCNGSYQFDLVSEIAPHYDWSLVPEKFRLPDYRAVGARPIYCQEAANPKFYYPCDLAKDHDVTFIGQCYGERPGTIRYLYEEGVPVCCYGANWRPSQPLPLTDARAGLPEHLRNHPLPDEELVKMVSRSKINLGFSVCGDTNKKAKPILQIRLRDFEIPMCGGFYMTGYMEELAEFYEIGKEIVCYHDRQDLRDKIRYYLSHDSEREAIRLAGYERCRRDHTWHKRFQSVFKQTGLA